MSETKEKENPLKEDQLFDELMAILRKQERSSDDMGLVQRAFVYAREKHQGQKRKNGENYIVHPVSVAIIITDIPVDGVSVASAILHDTLEDTDATSEELRKNFGDDVLRVVEGVTKLGKFEFSSAEDRQAENFRRMFLAMAHDIRVILVKLSDRTHNMRTLHYMKPEKQLKTATETLEIFAPLANRMGMGKIRAELEDLSLKFLKPDNYQNIEDEIAHTKTHREETINEVVGKIRDNLDTIHVKANIYGRVKNYYSIYKKMLTQQKDIHDIHDISAIRVIVSSEKECYEVLGVIHNAFKPIPGRFKDYIAMPKSNLYQSLHTTVMGPSGRPLEIQIRTEDMHRIAEYGIAAHWKYKEKRSGGPDDSGLNRDEEKLTWLRQMLEMKDEAQDASDYVESVKMDLFQDQVFVFTPKGRVLDMPMGSTPVDFAYRIHTEVGNMCTGAVVNGKMVPMNAVLENGDIVEIVTNKKSTPRLDWINFVHTQTAKSRIRQWFKKNLREEHEQQGRRLLEDELTRARVEEMVRTGRMLEVAKEINYSTLEDMYTAIGYGELNLTRVVNRLKKVQSVANQEEALSRILKFKTLSGATDDESRQSGKGRSVKDTSEIRGLQGMLYHLAKCCTPVPGEEICGVVTRSRGVMVHRVDCVNMSHVNPERVMELDWIGEVKSNKNHTVRLEVHVIDRLGVLKDILGKVAEIHTNVSNIRVKMHKDNTANIELTVDVSNLEHLDGVKRAIQKIPDVISVKRQQFRVAPLNAKNENKNKKASDGSDETA